MDFNRLSGRRTIRHQCPDALTSFLDMGQVATSIFLTSCELIFQSDSIWQALDLELETESKSTNS